MDIRSVSSIALASVLLVGMVSAASYSTEGAEGTYERGSSFTVTTDVTFDCVEEGTVSTQEYTVTIANKADYAWLNASQANVTYDPSECIGGGGSVTVEDVELNLTIGQSAPAFEDFDLQPGVVDGTNDGGNFTIDIAYDPGFTAPTALSFDAVAGGATATIPLVMAANADSTFNFDVTSFTFDGEPAPDGATAHIQDALNVTSPLADDKLASNTQVELHFGDHSGHEAGDTHEGMEDMEHGDDDAMAVEDGGHVHWETAQAVVSITLAAQEDSTQVSDAKEVVLTFVNTDEDTMPHQDDDGDGNETGDDDGGFFKSLPGYEAVAAVATLGAVAILARRRN